MVAIRGAPAYQLAAINAASTEWPPYLSAFGLPGRARTPLRAEL